jgi:hypothetical protein
MRKIREMRAMTRRRKSDARNAIALSVSTAAGERIGARSAEDITRPNQESVET